MSCARAGMSRSAQGPAGRTGIVDAQQFIVVAPVRTGVGGRSIGIAGVIHTSSQIRVVEVGVLMIQTESMSKQVAKARQDGVLYCDPALKYVSVRLGASHKGDWSDLWRDVIMRRLRPRLGEW